MEIISNKDEEDKELVDLIRRISVDIAKMGLVEGETQEVHNGDDEKFVEVYTNSYAFISLS